MSLDDVLSAAARTARQNADFYRASPGRRFSQSMACQLLALGEMALLSTVAALLLYPSARMPEITAADAMAGAAAIGVMTFLSALATGAASYDRFASRLALLPVAMVAASAGALSSLLGGAHLSYSLLSAGGLFTGVYVTRIPALVMKCWLERSGRLTRLIAVLSEDSAQIRACIRKMDERPDIEIVFTGSPTALTALDALTRADRLDEIVLADAQAAPSDVALLADLSVTLVRAMPENMLHRTHPPLTWGRTHFEGPWNMPVLVISCPPLTGWSAVLKRSLDLAGAVALLLLLGLPMLVVALAIRLESPGPALFVQERVGFRNSRFRMYKFRSMRNDCADASGAQLTLHNDPRVTKVGNFIRCTSIDELPQVLNVLIGNMSLVGPRPHPLAAKAGGVLYDELIPNFYSRYRMKPGITGLAQVSSLRGNTETKKSLIDRFSKDVEYADEWTPFLDIAILFRTIGHLLHSTNAF